MQKDVLTKYRAESDDFNKDCVTTLSQACLQNKSFKTWTKSTLISQKPLLSIIIVSYKAKEFVLKTLESLNTIPTTIPYEIIFIDNNSRDGTVDTVLSKYRTDILLELPANFGPAVARNIGLKLSKGDYILFLDSDVVLTQNSISEMLSFMQNTPECSVLVSKVYTENNIELRSNFKFPSIITWTLEIFLPHRLLRKLGRGLIELVNSDGCKNEPCLVEYSWTGCTLAKRETFEKIGLLDERFFFYAEDLDFYKRLNLNNLKAYQLPQARVIHYISRSSFYNKKEFYKYRFYNLQAKLIYARKYWKYSSVYLFKIVVMVKVLVTFAIDNLKSGLLSSGKSIEGRYKLSLMLGIFNLTKKL